MADHETVAKISGVNGKTATAKADAGDQVLDANGNTTTKVNAIVENSKFKGDVIAVAKGATVRSDKEARNKRDPGEVYDVLGENKGFDSHKARKQKHASSKNGEAKADDSNKIPDSDGKVDHEVASKISNVSGKNGEAARRLEPDNEEWKQKLRRVEQLIARFERFFATTLSVHLGGGGAGKVENKNTARASNNVVGRDLINVVGDVHKHEHKHEHKHYNYGNLGNVYKTRGELSEAEEIYKKALELNQAPGRKEGMAKDYVYKTQGELSPAEEMFYKASFSLGILYKTQHQYLDAKRVFELSWLYHSGFLHIVHDSYIYLFQMIEKELKEIQSKQKDDTSNQNMTDPDINYDTLDSNGNNSEHPDESKGIVVEWHLYYAEDGTPYFWNQRTNESTYNITRIFYLAHKSRAARISQHRRKKSKKSVKDQQRRRRDKLAARSRKRRANERQLLFKGKLV